MLLLLNLTGRGRPSDRDRWLLRTSRNFLPPCLAGDRSPLDPARTVGTSVISDPGSNCQDGCPFELCPYPPKDEENYRGLSEAFCRQQQVLLSGGSIWRRAAPWQSALPADLRRFWRQLGQPPQRATDNRGPSRRRGRRTGLGK